MSLKEQIESLFEMPASDLGDDARAAFTKFKTELNSGRVRAAEKIGDEWQVNTWVKKGILIGFRMGRIVDMSIDPERQPFLDKSTYPVRRITAEDGIRIVPGGSSIRDGCFRRCRL